ncbi:hypothetical protein F5Y15DRAFT_80908 [Xylariaceae sp. FL0016]|nr:hypothetical protein F5Y15DRAFT_80908 [Xylariaceae sp. FL0016]
MPDGSKQQTMAILIAATLLALAFTGCAADGLATITTMSRFGSKPMSIPPHEGLIGREPQDDPPTTSPETPNVTVTVTVTAVDPIETVTVSSTLTRFVWTSTTVAEQTLNCTRSIYAQPPRPTRPAPSPTPSSAPGDSDEEPNSEPKVNSPAPTWASSPEQLSSLASLPPSTSTFADPAAASTTSSALNKRQDDSPPPKPTTTISASALATDAITRTRTVWTAVTVTQPTPTTRTAYMCKATIAWLFTVNATNTLTYTRTAWETTTTSTSSISCRGISGVEGTAVPVDGAEGDDSVPVVTTIPASFVPPSLTSALASTSLTSASTGMSPSPQAIRRAHQEGMIKRQDDPDPTTPTPDNIITSTVYVTRTAYTVTTYTSAGATTALRRVCASPSYDITVAIPVTRTLWTTTQTVTSLRECSGGAGGRPNPPPFGVPPFGGGETTLGMSMDAGATGTGTGVGRRQDEPPPTATTTSEPAGTSSHSSRTMYVLTVTTLTEAEPSTRTVIRCSPSPTATPEPTPTSTDEPTGTT